METMQRFDFERHFSRFDYVTDDNEIARMRKEFDDYVAALNPAEREQFRIDFNAHLKWVNDRATFEIAFLKEMLAEAQPA